MSDSRFNLADHQLYAIEMMEANPQLAIWYDAGTGKTATALYWAIKALRRKDISSILVVCPASLTGNWHNAIDKMLMFAGVSEADVQALKDAVTITSFQKTYRITKKTVRHKNGLTSVKKERMLRDEVDKLWGAIIIDESHCIGVHNSNQTKACMTLAKMAGFRYILSGTPVHGGGGQSDYKKLFGQINFLDPGRWPTWKAFCEECIISYDPWGNPRKYRDADCQAIMQDYGIVARLQDCYDMPSSTFNTTPCTLAEKKVYKDIKDGFVLDYQMDIRNPGSQYIKLLQICSGSLKRNDDEKDTMYLKCSKDEALRDIISGTDDRVVVFCQYRASVDRIANIVRKMGLEPLTYDGRTKDKNAWMEFQNGKYDVFVGQYDSGGVGIDLYASHTMVFFEPTLSALKLEQTVARIMRKGQVQNCTYHFLTTPDTIESKVWDLVRRGRDISNDTLRMLVLGIDLSM